MSRRIVSVLCVAAGLLLTLANRADAQFYFNWGSSTTCYYNAADAFESRGDFGSAINQYNQILAICPSDETAYNNRGYDWYKLGRYDLALADYNYALQLCPTDASVYNNRGVLEDDQKEQDKALADYNQALTLNPMIAAAYNNRGVIESNHGQFEQSNADYYRSLSVDPNYIAAMENLAFLQSTCPDPRFRNGAKAFDNASKAYQMEPAFDQYNALNCLATAYAECGDFAKAVQWQEKTVAAAPASDKGFQTARLDLFKQGKPYRSTIKAATE